MQYLLFFMALVAIPFSVEARPPLHIALIPTGQERTPANLGNYALDLLEGKVRRSKAFILVERQRIAPLFEELTLQQSGLTQDTGAAELGQLLNVDKLIFFQFYRFYPGYEITLRIVDVGTGELLRVEQQRLGRHPGQIQQGVSQLAQRLTAIASLLSPAEMVFLPAGSLLMGSESGLADERPVHRVSISAFYLDRYEVSQIAFQEFLVSQGRLRKADLQGAELPATMVTWHEAAAYCQAQDKRLPTEAEWEYAARGVDHRLYPWGNAEPTTMLARFAAGSPLPVDSLPAGATPEGIHHLAGNVAEWVQDWWAPDYYAVSPEADPPGPYEGDYRVVRGGFWSSSPLELRSTARAYHNPERGANYIGFRCAWDAAP